jgi:hypothetical protein
MKNYFADVKVEHKGIGHFPIRWNRWSPDTIIFKSNRLVKKIMPESNILSYQSKGERDRKCCELTGGTKIQQTSFSGNPYYYYNHNKYRAVHVLLKDWDKTKRKCDYVSANVDFVDRRPNLDSVGNRMTNVDILTYINSMHNPLSHVYCSKSGQWVKDPNSKASPLDEGYRMAYGGQGEGMSMSMEDWDEYLDICKAIRMFLYEVVNPVNNEEFDLDQLEELMVA